MSSETGDSDREHVDVSIRKKKTGKVPRKIHKAQREKLKRDHMNELFLNLGAALGVDHPNNGKASILRDTIRFLGEMLIQVDNLKKENVALLSESNYVTVEKNELQEETCALDDQIKMLQREIDERGSCLNSDLTHNSLPKDHGALPLIGPASESASLLGPLYVMPLHNPEGFPEVNMPKVPSNVSKPRPRYPSSSDIWPSHILTKQTNVAEEV